MKPTEVSMVLLSACKMVGIHSIVNANTFRWFERWKGIFLACMRHACQLILPYLATLILCWMRFSFGVFTHHRRRWICFTLSPAFAWSENDGKIYMNEIGMRTRVMGGKRRCKRWKNSRRVLNGNERCERFAKVGTMKGTFHFSYYLLYYSIQWSDKYV